MISVKLAIENIKKKQGIKNNVQLEKNMGLVNGQLGMWANRNTLSIKLIEYCLKTGLSLDEMFRDEPPDEDLRCRACPLRRNVQILEDDDDRITVQIGLETTITARKKHQLQED